MSTVWKSLERFEADQTQRRRVLPPFQIDSDDASEVQAGGTCVTGKPDVDQGEPERGPEGQTHKENAVIAREAGV